MCEDQSKHHTVQAAIVTAEATRDSARISKVATVYGALIGAVAAVVTLWLSLYIVDERIDGYLERIADLQANVADLQADVNDTEKQIPLLIDSGRVDSVALNDSNPDDDFDKLCRVTSKQISVPKKALISATFVVEGRRDEQASASMAIEMRISLREVGNNVPIEKVVDKVGHNAKVYALYRTVALTFEVSSGHYILEATALTKFLSDDPTMRLIYSVVQYPNNTVPTRDNE